MPRNPVDKKAVSWASRYGTTATNNLPQYYPEKYVSTIITPSKLVQIQAEFPWVDLDDFHNYHVKCPYATEANVHLVRDTIVGSDTYWQNTNVINEVESHTLTSGVMIRHSRGSKHGWLCVDPNCPYYQGTVSGSIAGSNYFYI